MGLIRPKSAWETDPGAMLRARVITRGVRIVCPGVCAGVYTPEELEDAGHTAPDTPPTPPRPLRKSPEVQTAVAAVADALDGEIVDDGPASPMDPPPAQAKLARKKPAKATAPAAPAGPVNPHVCPIPGKKHGLDWGEMSRTELEYARNVDHPAMTDAHRARIDALLAPAAPDELPF